MWRRAFSRPRWGSTAVFLLLTVLFPQGARAQALQNAHFATPYLYIDANTTVADRWTPFRISQSPNFRQSDFEQMPGGPSGQVSSQQIWSDGLPYEAGVYQVVTGAAAGQTYRLSGWMLSIYKHGLITAPPYQDGYIYQRVGIDPYGGSNPSSANVIWSWDDLRDRAWRKVSVDAVAQSGTITVFLKTRNTAFAGNCLSFFDAFELQAANPVRISNLLIRPQPSGALVTWTTDTLADSKVYYAQYRGQSKNYTLASDSTLRTQHSINLTGLSPATQYYCQVVSSVSGRDDGIEGGHLFSTLFGQYYTSLLAARQNPDGTAVHLRDLVVSAGTNQMNTSLWLQQTDRASGIRVEKGQNSAVTGALVDVAGTLTTVSGERRLTGAVVAVTSSSAAEPLAQANRGVGGSSLDAYNPGVPGQIGPYNLGLLVTVWGRVTSVKASERYFYIDDGAGLQDGTETGRRGVRVQHLYAIGSVVPILGKYAVVTGPASCTSISGKTIPTVQLRSPSDLRQY